MTTEIERTAEATPVILKDGPELPVIFHANPFANSVQQAVTVEGASIATLMADAALKLPLDYRPYLRVWINDQEIAREEWEKVRVRAGQTVYIRVVPAGDGAKDIFRFIAMVAIMVVAAVVAPYIAPALQSTLGLSASAALTVATGLVTMVGFLALNALIPPPGLRGNNSQDDPRFDLTGTSNQFSPYGNIARVFGKRRLYPMMAARPYSEIQGDDEYLRMALCVGWGPLKIENSKIGETPITAFEGVEYEVREGWPTDTPLTLFSRTVSEESLSVRLEPWNAYNYTYNGYYGYGEYYYYDPATDTYNPYSTSFTSNQWVQRTTAANAIEFSVDFAFPQGLFYFNDKGERVNNTIRLEVEYRAVGGSTWLPAPWENKHDRGFGTNGVVTVTAADSSPVRRSGRVKLPAAGQYEVRVRRTTGDQGDKYIDATYWTNLRTIKPEYPVLQKNVALIAIRMKASNQLNGVPQTISCEATSYLPVWSGSAWSYQLSQNPAWAYVDLFRRRGGEVLLTDDRLDLTTLKAWADACAAQAPNANEPRWTYNDVIEGGSIYENLRRIAGNARAFPVVRDGKHSVVRDMPQSVPVQHITPRNSWGYKGTKAFIDYPHALRVIFVNPDKGYQQDERVVYYDGYNAQNATKFETLDLQGCTSAAQAYREARYHMAVARLRPEEHSVQMDIEALRCTVGDLVRFSHDAIAIGLGTGRVKSRVIDGTGKVTSITLDEEFYFEAGKSYAIRARLTDGTSVLLSINNPGEGYANTVTPTTPPTSAAAPSPGDLVLLGESTKESAPMIVKKIEAEEDFVCTVIMSDAADAVHTADTGTIPAFESYITLPFNPNSGDLPPVYISAVRSDDTAAITNPDGSITYRIMVQVQQQASSTIRAEYYEVQYRIAGTSFWQTLRIERDAGFGYIMGPEVGNQYELRARAVSSTNQPSLWSTIITHTVVGKISGPNAPTNFVATPIAGGIDLTWTNSTNDDFWQVELYENTSATLATATKIAETSANRFSRLGLTASDGLRFYWLKSFNTSGVAATVVGPVSAIAQNRSLNVVLSNEAVTILADANGNVSSYDQAEGFLYVTDGALDALAGATISVTASNCVGTINVSDGNPVAGKAKGYYRITSMSADAASLTFTVDYNGQTITKTFNATKAKQGPTGTSPAVLTLSSTAQSFTYDANDAAAPASQTITFTANLQNLTGNPTFTAIGYTATGASLGPVGLTGSGNTRTMTNAQFMAPGATLYVAVTASLAGFSDTLTVVRLQQGVAGNDAIVGFLTNEAVMLAAQSDGTVTDFTPAGGTFKVFQGLTDRTANCTFSVAASTNCTVTINSAGVYAVTGLTADTGYATLQAVYSGATIQKVLSLSKSKQGVKGDAGSPGAAGTAAITGYVTNENISLFAYADGTVASYSSAAGTFKVFQGVTEVSGNFTLSTLDNPQTLAVSYVGQSYSISSGFDANEDTATLTIRATGTGAFAGVVIDKVVTLSKAKGGYEIVAALPVSNLFDGRVVYYSGKLYRYVAGTGWTVEVDGADIKAGSITAAKMDVTSLSAISATIGTLRTAATGARTEISDNVIKVYDGNNVLRVKMGDLSL